MSAVSESIVREYFELHGFFVRQQRKYVAPTRREEEIDFLVLNPRPRPREAALPFVLGPADLPAIARAVVSVKGWHSETFSPTVLRHAPEIFRFVEPGALAQAARAFGESGPLLKVLVVPALPQPGEALDRSIEVLRARGIDAVLPFRTMLAELISRVEVNRNYQKSDLLQVLRILKNYDFFREPQLELFKPGGRRRRPRMNQSQSGDDA